MFFLNTGEGYTLFSKVSETRNYVDKTMMIDTLCQYVGAMNNYICVTRPRRFGKSVAANMIAAFFDKSTVEKSSALFERFELGTLKKTQEEKYAADPNSAEVNHLCWPWQGKMNVLRINMIDLLSESINSYDAFLSNLVFCLREDIHCLFPDLDRNSKTEIPVLLKQTGDSFVFVIDEWDAIFEAPFMTTEDRKKYLFFLNSLLKDKGYVHFAYMTGIWPIARYAGASPLNMFYEFSVFQDDQFYPYFGLSREEIQELMRRRGYSQPSPDDLVFWYDGYVRAHDGVHMFNPSSISRALIDGNCRSYWTGTGPMHEVRDPIRQNVQDLREEVVRMVGGETLSIHLSGFSVEKDQVSSKDEILSAMVVYGFLNYFDGQLRIPNHELLLKFQSALLSQELGLRQTLDESKRLLNATLEQRDREVADLLEDLHTEKIPFFTYNNENSLACVVTMGYLAALDDYRISREDRAGKGYADFTFEPRKRNGLPIILELKYNRSVKNALQCIREKEYIRRFQDYPKVLLVGINYSEKTKKHTCRTELVNSADHCTCSS